MRSDPVRLLTTMPSMNRSLSTALSWVRLSYMSQEQVRGEEIDTRSDVFSFGVALYEMATNQRPFAGKNRALIINAILNAQPGVASSVSPSSPTALDAIIAGALGAALEPLHSIC
jgi:serine/threonine protein kinase